MSHTTPYAWLRGAAAPHDLLKLTGSMRGNVMSTVAGYAGVTRAGRWELHKECLAKGPNLHADGCYISQSTSYFGPVDKIDLRST